MGGKHQQKQGSVETGDKKPGENWAVRNIGGGVAGVFCQQFRGGNTSCAKGGMGSGGGEEKSGKGKGKKRMWRTRER